MDVKIEPAALKDLFAIVWDANHNGALDAGDKLVPGNYIPYVLTEADEDPETFVRTIAALTGRIGRILKGSGLFAKNLYLALSYKDAPDVEYLVRVGRENGKGERSDLPDERLELVSPDDCGDAADKDCEKKRQDRQAAADLLMRHWLFSGWDSRLATAEALRRIEAAQTGKS